MELLGTYSKHQKPEISPVSVLDEALRGRRRRQDNKTPLGIRNVKLPRERVRVLSDDEVQELIECYKAGDSTYTVARRFGIHRTTVGEHLRRNGVTVRSRKLVSLDDNQRAEASALRESGMSTHRIAVYFGVADRAIARALGPAGRPADCAHATTGTSLN